MLLVEDDQAVVLGAPELIVVASLLSASIPSSAVGAIAHIQSREARPHAAAPQGRLAI